MFGKKGSKILKLPSVHSCFTLAMTNKLVVIINSLKVPKIKKMLLYEMKFLVQLPPEPLTRKQPPPDPHSLCPLPTTEFVEPPPQTKFLGTPLSGTHFWQTQSGNLWKEYYRPCRHVHVLVCTMYHMCNYSHSSV